MEEIIYTLWVRKAFGIFKKYFFKTGTTNPVEAKTKLMTLVGCIYSTSLEKVERINYQEKIIESDIKAEEILYQICGPEADIYIKIRKWEKEGA